MVKKAFKFEDYWASKIVRAIGTKEDYLCALVHKRFGESDVETHGGGEWVGFKTEPIYDMVFDNDPESETFQQRIPNPNTEPIGTKPVFDKPRNEKNVESFKKLVGTTILGTTQFNIRIDRSAYSADSEADIWETPAQEVRDVYTKAKKTVYVETGKKVGKT